MCLRGESHIPETELEQPARNPAKVLQNQLEDDTAKLSDDEWDVVSARLELDDDLSMESFWANVEFAVKAALPDGRLTPAA